VDPAEVHGALAEALADGVPWFVDFETASPVVETPPVAAWVEAETRRLARN
jgi:hypothetical protein